MVQFVMKHIYTFFIRGLFYVTVIKYKNKYMKKEARTYAEKAVNGK